MVFTVYGDEFIKQEKNGKYVCYLHHCYLFYVSRRGGRGGGVNLRCVDCSNKSEPWDKMMEDPKHSPSTAEEVAKS